MISPCIFIVFTIFCTVFSVNPVFLSDAAFQNVSHSEDKKQSDIMAVYRSRGVGNGFELYYETEQVFCRDEIWEDPNIPILEEKHRKEVERYDAKRAAECSAMPKRDVIHVMVQAFYGNRVITMADTEKVDQLIHGNTTYMDMEVDRKIVHLTQYDLQIFCGMIL